MCLYFPCNIIALGKGQNKCKGHERVIRTIKRRLRAPLWTFPGGTVGKNQRPMQGTQVQSLAGKIQHPLEQRSPKLTTEELPPPPEQAPARPASFHLLPPPEKARRKQASDSTRPHAAGNAGPHPGCHPSSSGSQLGPSSSLAHPQALLCAAPYPSEPSWAEHPD